jgi:hypothetical protein
MLKYLIAVEGKADITFLRDYLTFLSKDFNIEQGKKNSNKEIIIKDKYNEIKILVTGGYTSIQENKIITKFKEYIDFGYKILIIQDADNPNKNHGGVKNRIDYLTKIKEKLEIEFETFLFPNNKDDGDLETLLLKIASKNENYNKFNECNIRYRDNIHNIAPNFSHELTEGKYQVFHYFRTFYGNNRAKEENREYIEKYWDLNNVYLKPLELFLKKHIPFKK